MLLNVLKCSASRILNLCTNIRKASLSWFVNRSSTWPVSMPSAAFQSCLVSHHSQSKSQNIGRKPRKDPAESGASQVLRVSYESSRTFPLPRKWIELVQVQFSKTFSELKWNKSIIISIKWKSNNKIKVEGRKKVKVKQIINAKSQKAKNSNYKIKKILQVWES